MKRIIRTAIGGLLLFLSIGQAGAEITTTGTPIKIEDSYLTYLYPEFNYENKTQFCMWIKGADGHTKKLGIYDDQFQHIKTFDVPMFPSVTATYTVQKPLCGPIGIEAHGPFEQFYAGYHSIDEANNYINKLLESGYEKKEVNGEIRFYHNSDFYYPQFYGTQYPTSYYVLKEYDPESDYTYSLYLVTFKYDYSEYVILGYSEAIEYMTRTPGIITVPIKSDKSNYLDSAPITQTLFNQNAEYEFLVPNYTTVNYAEDFEWGKESGEKIVENGLNVVTEIGNTIASIPYPSGMYRDPDENAGYNIFITTAGTFIVVTVKDEADDTYIVTYRVDNVISGIRQVGEPVKCAMKVTPSAPARGTTVNVSMTPAEKGTRLSVIATDGQRVFQRSLESGTTSTQIETGRLASGIYVVVLEDSKGSRENCKIIIR